MNTVCREVRKELESHMIPFWKGLRDDTYGGYYGWFGYDLVLDKKAEKGCILNSRILWFFSRAYTVLGDESLLQEAKHGYEFLMKHCLDKEYGGILWSLQYDGTPLDTTKHTYNQAFAIYALSAYYEATGEKEALQLALDLYQIIETKCRDEEGYLEAFTREFQPMSNDKLSENGVIAQRTMNTLLHVLEAYTQLYRVSKEEAVKEQLKWILTIIEIKLYDPVMESQRVFMDLQYNSLLDLQSYGHDIEASWLMDLALDVIDDEALTSRIRPINQTLAKETYEKAYDGRSIAIECENGVVLQNRVWWAQAESMVGFLNAYQKDHTNDHYLDVVRHIWEFTKTYLIDKRPGSEWYWEVHQDGTPIDRAIVEPWKCPYHAGRMCLEFIERTKE